MKKARIEALSNAIQQAYGCASEYVESSVVKDRFAEHMDWDGMVDLFEVQGHAKASQCYAWSYRGAGRECQHVAVLRIPPVIDSAAQAVQAFIISQYSEAHAPAIPL